jgi:hypothetical protein
MLADFIEMFYLISDDVASINGFSNPERRIDKVEIAFRDSPEIVAKFVTVQRSQIEALDGVYRISWRNDEGRRDWTGAPLGQLCDFVLAVAKLNFADPYPDGFGIAPDGSELTQAEGSVL